jgi:hypothetical protein
MTNRPPSPTTGADFATAVTPDPDPVVGRPRWVKVFGIIALVLAVLFVGLKVTGLGGNHGPGLHSGGTPPSGVTEDGGQTPPAGMNHG